jgi:hypothetical protein
LVCRRDKKRRPDALAAALGLAFALGLALAPLAHAEERQLDLGGGNTLRYEVLAPGAHAASARSTARVILRHLSEGDIRAAAALSNAPARREEVLRDFQASVGEEEFKRVFSQYLARAEAVVAEVAIGAHRLLIWQLAGKEVRLTGQFYVEKDGRFLLDDVPSETRANLRRVLQSYREAATASERKD